MMAKTHIVIGVGATMLYLEPTLTGQNTPQTFMLMFLGVFVGSILPDIDHPQSLISQMIPFVGGLIGRLLTHRGILHSWLPLVLIAGIALQAPEDIGVFLIGVWIGYLLHLTADMFTPSGIPLLYPFRFRFRIPVLVTAGIFESLLRGVLVRVIGVYIVLTIYEVYVVA